MVGVLIINHFLNYTCIVLFIQHISVCVGSLQGPRSLEPPLSHSTLSSSFPSYIARPHFPPIAKRNTPRPPSSSSKVNALHKTTMANSSPYTLRNEVESYVGQSYFHRSSYREDIQ